MRKMICRATGQHFLHMSSGGCSWTSVPCLATSGDSGSDSSCGDDDDDEHLSLRLDLNRACHGIGASVSECGLRSSGKKTKSSRKSSKKSKKKKDKKKDKKDKKSKKKGKHDYDDDSDAASGLAMQCWNWQCILLCALQLHNVHILQVMCWIKDPSPRCTSVLGRR